MVAALVDAAIGAVVPDVLAAASRPPTTTSTSTALSAAVRPPCPAGWTDVRIPTLGLLAHVPAEYWVRLRGGWLLTVEKQGDPATLAFLLPFRPRADATAAAIAERFARFVTESQPQFQATIEGSPLPDLVRSRFTSVVSGQAVTGAYRTVVGAGGTMAYVIGVMAPAGGYEAELPRLRQIAQGFGFQPPRGRWSSYVSPAGGFTLTFPEGWQVQSGDGVSGKDNIDWVASDPGAPSSRAFQWCPRYCSPQLLQDPLHAMRGYQAGQFPSHEAAVAASLGQIAAEVRVRKLTLNQPLTDFFRRQTEQVARLLAGLNAGQIDIAVYDCQADARVDGQPVVVAFLAGLQTLTIQGGIFGPLVDLSITLRGWCAAPERFVRDSPVLEKVCASMQLTPAFLRRIVQGNEQAATTIRETYAHLNRIDDQIRQSRWDTMDAVAEMNYDVLRDTGGYVNEATGRIEQIPPEKVVKNSHGEYVSREEVARGISPDQATVLREAHVNDYLRGVYGRIEF